MDVNDNRNPSLQAQYREEEPNNLPLTESLKDTIDRVIPYFNTYIKQDIINGKRVLITSHGNSLRAMVMHFEKLSANEIQEINIPTGIPLVYKFNDEFNIVRKHYLGDPEKIKDMMDKVSQQGKSH